MMTDPNQPQGQNPKSADGAPHQPPQSPAPPYAAPAPTYPGAPAAAPYPGSPPPYPGAGGTPYPSASGTPYPGPSAPYPGPAATSDRTNPISILAIIAGFIVPIVGVISGIVALTQIKRTGEKGRGLAITGISVGGALMVLGAAALLLFGFLVSIAEDSVSSYDSYSETVPGEDGGGTEQDVFDLAVGDCLLDTSSGEIFSVPVVDCAVPHDYEVYAEVTLTDAAEFPGEDAVFTEADQLCLEPYAAYVGAEWEVSELNYSYYSPTPESWSEGDRGVTCLVLDPSGQLLTGSVAGSGR